MRLMCIASFLVILLVVFACKSGRTRLTPGQRPPDFVLPDLAGVETTLNDFRGKLLVLNFWGTWCEPCVAEMPALQRLQNQLGERGLQVLAISVNDSQDNLRRFKRRHNLTFPLLYDASGEIGEKYGLTGVPETFVIDQEGRLVLMPDLESGQPLVRVVGPRRWDSRRAIVRFTRLLEK